ncbi:MAG: GNAT family N-acetyltransferase [Patescibacteria group bacterium]|nr:GNAT family N-acetyltransferase [Patescibacteria group bacterium]
MNIIVKPLSTQTSSVELARLFRYNLTKMVAQIDTGFLMQEEDCYCCEVRWQGGLIGFGALSMRIVPTKGFVGMLEDIVVDDQYQGMGIGTAIVEHLLEKAQTLKLARVDLTSNPRRTEARKLYQKQGFTLTDTNLFRKNL